ncbi:hypothetical protein HHK36_017867 [Tetracentron sinense]|uniref:DUF4283 domain-containing protein n=1 Tax=Tetracentron sinense TaxID=13715 RepID=A0A834YXX0_TETSI|nr:hypothetical protein HHK36_017867 [Tetracentron sinense]
MANPRVASGEEGVPIPRPSHPSLDKPDTYASVVGGSSRSGNRITHLNDFSFDSIKDVKKVSSFQGELALFYSVEELNTSVAAFKHALIAKFSYGRSSIEALKNYIQGSFHTKLAIAVGILDESHMLIRFESEEDFLAVWLKEFSYLEGQLVRFIKWTPLFQVGVDPTVVPVWISLPGLPINLFNPKDLKAISSIVGRVLKVDGPTRTISRPSLWRICVEVDVKKEKISIFWLGLSTVGRWQSIVYEKEPKICASCNKMGHSKEDCNKSVKKLYRGVDPRKLKKPMKDAQSKEKRMKILTKDNHFKETTSQWVEKTFRKTKEATRNEQNHGNHKKNKGGIEKTGDQHSVKEKPAVNLESQIQNKDNDQNIANANLGKDPHVQIQAGNSNNTNNNFGMDMQEQHFRFPENQTQNLNSSELGESINSGKEKKNIPKAVVIQNSQQQDCNMFSIIQDISNESSDEKDEEEISILNNKFIDGIWKYGHDNLKKDRYLGNVEEQGDTEEVDIGPVHALNDEKNLTFINIELENRRSRSTKARIPADPNAWQQIRENFEAIILEDHAFSEQNETEFALWQLHYKRIEELRTHFSAAVASTGTLAILAAYSGDELASIYRYFRSLAADSPFSTARDNLIMAFEKNRQSYTQLLGDGKASLVKTVPVRMSGKGRRKGEARLLSKDTKMQASSKRSISDTFKAFCTRFVRLNGILFTRTSLETFGEVFSLVCSDLHELLSSGLEEELNFGSDAVENGLVIVRLISILIFTVHNVNREVESQSYAEILQRSVLLQNAFTAVFEFMGHILERGIQLHDPLSSYLLPGILVFVEWLACCPDIAAGNDAEEKQAIARSFFWKHCISFLNKLLSSGFVSKDDDVDESCFFNMSSYDEAETGNRLALWEDFELRGFLPLLPAQLILDFSRKHSFGSDGSNKDNKSRMQRILAAGKALADVVRVEQQGIYFDTKEKKFAIGVEPQMSDDFMLASFLDMPKSNGMQENPVETMYLGVVQPKGQLYMEEEEEDEVIVFKPTVTEKPTNVIAPKWTSYEVPEPGKNTSKGEWGSNVASVSSPSNYLGPQTALDASSRPPTSFVNIVPQSMQQIQPSVPKWLVEQQASLATSLKRLSFMENGLVMKPELHGGLGVLQPDALSLPLAQSVNLTSGSMFSGQRKDASKAVIPSKFDSIMSSGANADSPTVNTSSTLLSNLKKNPVSRPVRHFGPPPGFSHFPPKHIDEQSSGSALKNENPLMDDYSWLDGYELPPSTKGTGAHNSIIHSTHVYPNLMANSSSLTETMNFPFPGKLVPTVQVQLENQKAWQDYQLHEHLKLNQEQQKQLPKGNLQSTRLPEQYEGQLLRIYYVECPVDMVLLSSASTFAALSMSLNIWSMDGLGVLQARASETGCFVRSFPDGKNRDCERDNDVKFLRGINIKDLFTLLLDGSWIRAARAVPSS